MEFPYNQEVQTKNVYNVAIIIMDGRDFKVSEYNQIYLQDLSDNLIPARWSAPESILDDLYDTKSDTYMFGHFIQEIFTHGCQPYTELFNISTEQVLTWSIKYEHNLTKILPERYKCTNGMNLYDIASKCHFGNPLEKSNKIKYLSVVYGLAEYISSLHDFDFIHRDIQCKFLYFSLENNQIICPRIGRMLYIPPTIIDDSILEGVFEDNKNWMPIELLEHLYGGERLYQPEHCPDWLFDIIINCWDRDRTRRPSMKTILKHIHKQFQSLPSGTMSSTEEYPNSDSEFGIYSTDDSSLEDGNQQSNSPISIPQIFNSRLGLNFYRPKSTVDISPTGNFRTPTKESSESENDSSWPKSTRKPSFEEPRIKSLNGLDKTRSKSTSNLPNKSCVKQKSVKFKNRVTFNHLLFDNDSEKRLLSNSYEENVDTQNINDKYCQKSEELIPELQIHVAKNDKNTTFEDNSKQCLNGNTKDDQRLSKDKKLGEGNRSSFNATESRKSSFSCINDSFSSSDIEFQQYRINSLKVTSDSSFKSKPPPKCNHLPKDDVTNMTSDQCVKKKPVNFPCGNHRSSRIPCINSSSSSEDTNVNSSNTNGFSTESRSLTVGVNSADQHNLTATTSQGSILRNTIKNFFSNFSKYNHNKKDDEETSDYLTPIW
ncbi:hypothetical protein KUTeg_019855 [Tegillarca granosa]|uniref:Protein kinase domain-containing protein n=1 Tax=Tegillarca granosa TaxID=220873 RepID=A0ABQ9EDS7_TEGGR|nr:hypothetical protein KUTeg_019855 [Tegillarca granosa]